MVKFLYSKNRITNVFIIFIALWLNIKCSNDEDIITPPMNDDIDNVVADNDNDEQEDMGTSINSNEWVNSSRGLQNSFSAWGLAADRNGVIYAAGAEQPFWHAALYFSEDNGENWHKIITTGLEDYNYIYGAITIKGDRLIMQASTTNTDLSPTIFYSDDSGRTWDAAESGLQNDFSAWDLTVGSDGTIYAVGAERPAWNAALYSSQDDGENWSKINTTGLTDYNYIYGAITAIGNRLVMQASTTNSSLPPLIFYCDDKGRTWEPTVSGLQNNFSAWSLTTGDDSIIYAAGAEQPAWNAALYSSEDNGENWNKIDTDGLENHSYIYGAIVASGNKLIMQASTDNTDLNPAIYITN